MLKGVGPVNLSKVLVGRTFCSVESSVKLEVSSTFFHFLLLSLWLSAALFYTFCHFWLPSRTSQVSHLSLSHFVSFLQERCLWFLPPQRFDFRFLFIFFFLCRELAMDKAQRRTSQGVRTRLIFLSGKQVWNINLVFHPNWLKLLGRWEVRLRKRFEQDKKENRRWHHSSAQRCV